MPSDRVPVATDPDLTTPKAADLPAPDKSMPSTETEEQVSDNQ